MKRAIFLVLALVLGMSFASLVHGDSPQPEGRPAPPAPGAERAWLEERDGGRVILQPGEVGVPAPHALGTLHVRVLNQQGLPAASAYVEAFRSPSSYPTTGYTNASGEIDLSLADGTWTLVVSSEDDHFVVMREGVASPGSLTVDTAGTVPVDLSARRADGQPLANASYSLERLATNMSRVGSGDALSHLRADVTPGTYCGSASNWAAHYFLTRPGIVINGVTAVAFDAVSMGTGEVELRFAGGGETGLTPQTDPECRRWASVFDLVDGARAVLSAGRWALGLHLELRDAADTRWIYYQTVKDTPHTIAPGSVTTVWSGGALAASIAPAAPSYQPGAVVQLIPSVLDSYGNRQGQISRGPSQEVVKAHLVIRAPGGAVEYEQDWSSTVSRYSVTLPRGAAQGTHTVDWSLDTGPLAGVLHATAGFQVAGDPLPLSPTPLVTPTATRTATPTPTRTATPTITPTPSPTGPWLQWRDVGRELPLAPGGASVEVVYGNIPVPATLRAQLTWAALFAGGGQTLTTGVASAGGSQALALRPAPGAVRGAAFTLNVTLGGRQVERSGAVAWGLDLSLVLKLH